MKLIDMPKDLLIKWIPIPSSIVKILLQVLTGEKSNLIDFDNDRTKLLINTFGYTSSYNIVLWNQRAT